MASMKISNYSGTANTFTWPNNPRVFDNESMSNHTLTEIGYQRHHIAVSGGGIAPKSIVLTGHFNEQDSADKRADFRTLAGHFNETTKLKKLYWETDKFFLGLGKQLKETNSGGRTNFIDYVGVFQTIIGILLSDTEKSSGTNDGDATTFVTEITGTVTSGASDITISDNLGNSVKIPASALTTGHTITLKLVDMVDSGSGIYVTEYNYLELNGSASKQLITTGGFGLLQLAAGANVSTITTTNITGATVKFRDGYSA